MDPIALLPSDRLDVEIFEFDRRALVEKSYRDQKSFAAAPPNHEPFQTTKRS